MTIVEFLVARIRDDCEAQRQRLIERQGISVDDAEAVEALSKTFFWASIGANEAGRVFGVHLAASMPIINDPWLRGMAAKHRDHPDYDPAWAPD